MTTAEHLTWVAHSVTERGLLAARRLASALGLTIITDTESSVVCRTSRGDIVEFCGPRYVGPEYLFARQRTVTGYLVADLHHTSEAIIAADFAAVSDPTSVNGVQYRHFRGPDDVIFGCIQIG